MGWLILLNKQLSRCALYITIIGLFGIWAVVNWGVLKRYVFNDPQPYVEQVALLLVIVVAMFGAAVVVRDEGHIGMETLVVLLPQQAQYVVGLIGGVLTTIFGALLAVGCTIMAVAVAGNIIPTLPISEVYRYAPGVIAGVLIIFFSIEHLIAMVRQKEVVSSWN
jgi:TRAP-type C4-dicarboxylate transport system permease small subunit